MKLRNYAFAVVTMLVGFVAVAAVDVTSTMEFIGNPSLNRWPKLITRNKPRPRAVIDLQFYQGRLYVGNGEVESNPGPCPIYSIDPDTRIETLEYSAGTEEIAGFHLMSWGGLAATSEDPHENDPNLGHIFSRNTDTGWSAHKGINFNTRYIASYNNSTPVYKSLGYAVHSWDMIEHDGQVFVAGYGISASSDRFATFRNASTCMQEDGVSADHREYFKYSSGNLGSMNLLERETHFVKVGDELFAVYNGLCSPFISRANGKSAYLNIGKGFWYNSSSQQFELIDTDLESIFPGLSSSDFALSCGLTTANSVSQVPTEETFCARLRIWRPTPFKGRCLYVACVDTESISGVNGSLYTLSSYPLSVAGYTATTATGDSSFPHKFQATKLDFGGAFPMDIVVDGDVCYILTTKYDSSDKQVLHGIWKSTDGISFEQIATFKFHQNFISLEYRNGYFYVGCGFKTVRSDYTYDSQADESGAIYRVKCPVEPIHVVASAAKKVIDNGASDTVGFSLSAAPTSNITVRVVSSLGADSNFEFSKSSLTFTPSDWNVEQSVKVTAKNAAEEWARDSLVVGVDSGFDPVRGSFVNPEVSAASVFLEVQGGTPKAVFDASTLKLKFYYDKKDHSGEGTVYPLGEDGARTWGSCSNGNWSFPTPAPTNVTFDASFKDYRPKTCASWFMNMNKVVGFNGMKNLDVSESMVFSRMFYGMNSPDFTALDLSGFSTPKSDNITQTFCNCTYLETIYVSTNWTVSSVVSAQNTFNGCKALVGGCGTEVYTNGVAQFSLGAEYARIDTPTTPGFFTYKEGPDDDTDDPPPGHTHVWGEWVTNTAPTCVVAGQRTRSCIADGCWDPVTTQSESVPALGHSEVIDPYVAPTETETGLTEGSHCSRCGAVLVKQNVIPAIGVAGQIANGEQFVSQITADPSGVFKLIDDIDLSEVNYTAIANFSGTLLGQGHTITGFGSQPLFEVFSGIIRDVKINGNGATISGSQTAAICKEARGASFEDVTVGNVTISVNEANKYTGIGLFVGMAYDGTSFVRCETLSTATVSGNNIANDNLGGFVGKVLNETLLTGDIASFTDCTNNAVVLATSGDNNGLQGTGGFVGKVELTATAEGDVPAVRFLRCQNHGDLSVSLKAAVGGFVGRELRVSGSGIPQLIFDTCVNDGDITTSKEITASGYYGFGGFVGFLGTNARPESEVTFSKCVNRGEINAGDAIDAGGFIGKSQTVLVKKPAFVATDSANYGTVHGLNAGGIIGCYSGNAYNVNGFTIRNCANYGEISAATAGLSGEFFGSAQNIFNYDLLDNVFAGSSNWGTYTVPSGKTTPAVQNTIAATDMGYAASAAVDALNTVASAKNLGDWVVGKDEGGNDRPELKVFCTGGSPDPEPYDPPVIDYAHGGFEISGGNLTLKIASPVQNAWYTLFTADTLTDTFTAVESVQYTGGEVPTFEIPTTGASKFATIGISNSQIPVNTPLE